ncbi:MAG: hypothetical protein NTW17_03490 [Candidatus Pacearchaeota archaeon]|nr:hypothetical protein [Candidatus Pacearchaeota archaeon]
MRILKKCRKKQCRQLFNVIDGVNLIEDKKGSFKAVCPWCSHHNHLTKSEQDNLLIRNI